MNSFDFFSFIKEYWQIVAFVGTIIFSWAYFQSTVNTLQDKVHIMEANAADTQQLVSGISGDIKAINAKLDLIIDKRITY